MTNFQLEELEEDFPQLELRFHVLFQNDVHERRFYRLQQVLHFLLHLDHLKGLFELVKFEDSAEPLSDFQRKEILEREQHAQVGPHLFHVHFVVKFQVFD